MKFTASLFTNEKDLVEAFKKKALEMQKSGTVGQPFEGKIDGKSVKLWLPEDVKQQYRAVIDAEAFIHTGLFTSVDDTFALRMKIWTMARTHMLYDGKEGCKMSDDDFTVDVIEQVITLYLAELLFPLYHGSCTRAEEALRSRLTSYMSPSVSE